MTGKELRIGDIRTADQSHLVEAEFRVDSRTYQIYFRSNDARLTPNLEAFLTCALLPSLRQGGSLVADGEVSRRLLASIPTIVDIYTTWDSSLHKVVELRNVIAVEKNPSEEQKIGTFFSGGVDSFYTLLKHQDVITDLVFVHGFDIRLDDAQLRAQASETIRKVAGSFGKRVIEVETNLRSLLDPYCAWGSLANGAALSAVGHLLSPTFSRVFIPASHTYAQLFPWGSHPLLDPLWSSEALQFVHDGCEASRIDKVLRLAECDVALRSLRVCWENRNGAYNCGECEKCLRTMINLYVVGALDRCTTFEKPLRIRRILSIDARDDNTRAFVLENLEQLQRRRGDMKLCHALRRVLNRDRWSRTVRETVKGITIDYPGLDGALRRIDGGLRNLTSRFRR